MTQVPQNPNPQVASCLASYWVWHSANGLLTANGGRKGRDYQE